MESQHDKHPNKIQVSKLGAVFLKQLSQESLSPTASSINLRQNVSANNYRIKRRGEGIQFQQFANQTQVLISRQLKTLYRVKTEATDVTQTKRKQILHHNNWINQQKLISHKVSDAQARIEQLKYSEYDWRKQSLSLKKIKFDILHQWQTVNMTREKRLKSKIKTMMDKKYPKISESGLARLFTKKKLF